MVEKESENREGVGEKRFLPLARMHTKEVWKREVREEVEEGDAEEREINLE